MSWLKKLGVGQRGESPKTIKNAPGSPGGYMPPARRGMVFGAPIEDLSGPKEEVPHVVVSCVNYLESKALSVEGLFRIPGNGREVSELKDAYDAGQKPDMSTIRDEHVVAGLLKAYFRELPEPVTTHALYKEFVSAAQYEEEPDRVAFIKSVVERLPNLHYRVLEFLTKFLFKVHEKQEVNKMNASNLGIVFGPNLFRSKADDISSMVRDVGAVKDCARLLVQYYNTIFTRGSNSNEIELSESTSAVISSEQTVQMSPADLQNLSGQPAPKSNLALHSYKEYDVIKINRHAKRQERVMGISHDTIFNLPPINPKKAMSMAKINGTKKPARSIRSILEVAPVADDPCKLQILFEERNFGCSAYYFITETNKDRDEIVRTLREHQRRLEGLPDLPKDEEEGNQQAQVEAVYSYRASRNVDTRGINFDKLAKESPAVQQQQLDAMGSSQPSAAAAAADQQDWRQSMRMGGSGGNAAEWNRQLQKQLQEASVAPQTDSGPMSPQGVESKAMPPSLPMNVSPPPPGPKPSRLSMQVMDHQSMKKTELPPPLPGTQEMPPPPPPAAVDPPTMQANGGKRQYEQAPGSGLVPRWSESEAPGRAESIRVGDNSGSGASTADIVAASHETRKSVASAGHNNTRSSIPSTLSEDRLEELATRQQMLAEELDKERVAKQKLLEAMNNLEKERSVTAAEKERERKLADEMQARLESTEAELRRLRAQVGSGSTAEMPVGMQPELDTLREAWTPVDSGISSSGTRAFRSTTSFPMRSQNEDFNEDSRIRAISSNESPVTALSSMRSMLGQNTETLNRHLGGHGTTGNGYTPPLERSSSVYSTTSQDGLEDLKRKFAQQSTRLENRLESLKSRLRGDGSALSSRNSSRATSPVPEAYSSPARDSPRDLSGYARKSSISSSVVGNVGVRESSYSSTSRLSASFANVENRIRDLRTQFADQTKDGAVGTPRKSRPNIPSESLKFSASVEERLAHLQQMTPGADTRRVSLEAELQKLRDRLQNTYPDKYKYSQSNGSGERRSTLTSSAIPPNSAARLSMQRASLMGDSRNF